MGGLSNAFSSVSEGASKSFGFGTGATRPSASDISPTFTAGGLRTDISGSGRIEVKSDRARKQLVSDLAGVFGRTAGELGGIRDLTRPGFSAFREAGLEQIENRRISAVGNLRDNLARRRVLGSSFGQDSVARAEAEFAQEAGQFAAATTLQELDTFRALSERISEFQQNELLAFVNELNLQVDVARGLQAGAQQAISAAATVQQQNAGAFQRQLLDTGSTLGAAAILCWVARAVYGSDNPAWMDFRDRMLEHAPMWFIDLYIKHGPRVASVVHRLPFLKTILRPLMDRAWRYHG